MEVNHGSTQSTVNQITLTCAGEALVTMMVSALVNSQLSGSGSVSAQVSDFPPLIESYNITIASSFFVFFVFFVFFCIRGLEE